MKMTRILGAFVFILAGCANNQGQKSDVTHEGTSLGSGISDSANAMYTVVKPKHRDVSISVGGEDADGHGFTSQAIQLAAEALKSTGGVIRLEKGTYDIKAPVKLYSNETLTGTGQSTVLKKCKGVRSPFALDADYGELQATVKDPSGFAPGMGIAVYDSVQRSGFALTTAVITAIDGHVLHFDNYLERDYSMRAGGTVSNACSVIAAVNAENVTISNLQVDGNRETNDMVDGCRAGGIYLFRVVNSTVDHVVVRNFNCDGISWQTTENVTVSNCEVSGCANAGLHPGTGSPRTRIEANNVHDNDHFGLFVCWRVRDGVVRNNNFHNNGGNGICTGHKDTGILFEKNHIYQNGADGVCFRGETAENAPNNTIFRDNLVENNGAKETGYGFSFNSPARGVVLEGNIIRNTHGGKQLAACCLYPNGLPVTMKNNQVSGHPKGELVKVK